jgi:hypothetical protein
MDFKKEIKLSDLFKRKPKEPKAQAPVVPPTAPEAPAQKTSFLKRDLSLSLRRRPKDPDFDAGPPKAEKKPKRAKAPRIRKDAPAVPQIPLMRAFNLMPTEDPQAAAGRRPKPAQLVLAVVVADESLVEFAIKAAVKPGAGGSS